MAHICVFFSTSALGQKGPPPPFPHLTGQFSVLPKLLIFIWCGLLSHCTLENCLNRRDKKETGLIFRPGMTMPFSRLVHRKKQSSKSSKLPHHFLFCWLPSLASLVWAVLETNKHPHFLPLYGQKSKMTTLWECFHLVENNY